MKKLLTILALSLNLTLLVPSALAADAYDFRNTFEDFQSGVEQQSGDLENDTESIVLPNFQDDQATEDGTSGIVNAVKNFMDFFKLLMTPIILLFIAIMGIKMLFAGSENEEVMTKSKNFVRYAVEGLIMIFISSALVDVFFGATGEVLRGGDAGAAEQGRQVALLFQGLYGLMQVIIGVIAVAVLIFSGMRYIAGSYSDEHIGEAKKQITWALVGLVIVGISEFVAKKILFPNQGTSLGLSEANNLFAQITNFVAGVIGTLSFAFGLYAGYLYVTARENEDQVGKAKKILVGVIIGIVLALAAFAITNTLVTLDIGR